MIGYEGCSHLLAHKSFYFDLSPFWEQYSRLQSFSAPVISFSGGDTYLTVMYENQIKGHTSGFEFAPRVTITP